MKKFFLGLGLGLGIQLICALGIYRIVASFSSVYVDSSAFLVEYPAIIAILISIYLIFAKKEYKIVLGIFVGILLSIALLSILLAGA